MAKTPKKAGGQQEGAPPVTTGPSHDGRPAERHAVSRGPRNGKTPGRHALNRAARERRTTPTLLAGLAVVTVGALGFLVLGRSGLNRSAPPSGPAPVTSPSVGGELITPDEASPSPSTFELSEARDPFRPLIVPPPEGAPASPVSPGSTASAGASPSPSVSPGSGAGESSAPQGGEDVELLDIVMDDQGTTRAQVKVGSTVSTVAAGETFASTYKLLSIQIPCATLQNGADTFTLCKGDQVLK